MRVATIRSIHAQGAGSRGTRRGGAVLALVALAGCGLSASGLGAYASGKKAAPRAGLQTKPWTQVSLDALGFPGISETFLQAGASMLTVNILDDSHLLVTFSLRNLVPRLTGDPTTDDDRLVQAQIVDLPSGKVEARTVWHMHDHGRYLWSLGEGRFLVRIGSRLSTMMPLAHLGAADPFERTAFPDQEYEPSAVFVSPGGGLITLESVVAYVNPDGRAEVLLGDVGADKPVTKTVIQFFRVHNATSGEMLEVTPAGKVISDQPVLLPVDADGFLDAEETARNVWSMSFDEFGGKTINVGKLDSTCFPQLQMVSRGEFVAFPCQGLGTGVKIASYGLDGHETWEEGMGDIGSPVFAFAPAAGRFAMSQSKAAIPGPTPTAGGGDGTPARQEVRVYQNASGDLLLKAECSPILKSGENFDLSNDGLLAAVVRNGAIAVYKLPPPSKGDHEDMAEVAKFTPPAGNGDVTLQRLLEPVENAKSSGAAAAGLKAAAVAASVTPVAAATGSAAGVGAPAMTQAALAAGSAPGVLGGPARRPAEGLAALPVAVVSQGPAERKAPTLLNPGEKPEFGASNAEQPN